MVPNGSTSEGDYGFQAMQENTTPSICFGRPIVLLSQSGFHRRRSRAMPRRLTDSRVLDSIREDRRETGYGSEVSLLVESQLSLDLGGLFP